MKLAHAILIGTLFAVVPCSGAFGQQSSPKAEIVELWLASPHADQASESFSHWNDEGEIPENCAVCHSGSGFRFYGLDGSTAGEIAHPVAVGGVIDCATCHDDGVENIDAVTFPSGITVSPTDSTATCLTCHQGRQSGIGVDAQLVGMDDDTVNAELAFINSHYASAAATQLGTEVKGGYEYPGQTYMGRFVHAPSVSTCVECHDPHSLEVKVDTCIACHQTDDPRSIRMSSIDFDGDGATVAGIHSEIAALSDGLLEAIRRYADDKIGIAIAYADRYPYFFNAEAGDATGDRYASWTPALLRAAYNYQFVTKDPGAYAHNPHYALQLLHDSVSDLAERAGFDPVLGERP